MTPPLYGSSPISAPATQSSSPRPSNPELDAMNTELNKSPSRDQLNSSASQIFSCNQCPRNFTRRENLSRHVKTHTAPWAHRCQTCGKGFARSDLLSRHEISHQRWSETGSNASRPNISNKRMRQTSFENVASLMSPESADYSNASSGNTVPNAIPRGTQMSPAPLALESHANNDQFAQPSTARLTRLDNQSSSRPVFFQAIPRFTEPAGYHDTPQQEKLYHSQEPFYSGSAYQQPGQNSDSSAIGGSDFMPLNLPGSLPQNSGGHVNEMFNGWFSNDFYLAMQETGNEILNMGEAYEDIPLPFNDDSRSLQPPLADQGSAMVPPNLSIQEGTSSNDDENALSETNNSNGNEPGSVSRMASPPNEASEEDKWAFAWDPKSRAILSADPIHFPLEHQLRKQHNPRFDISEQTYQKVQRFVSSRIEGMSNYSELTLPTLQEANIFIGLYFEHFSPKMAVLHHASINTNEDLPPPLLGGILVIGAMYSQLRGTRRFAIVLLDIVRTHLQVAVECNNSLMRDPKIIFAETLICYAGLWCGNKRAFELAEVVRGTVVKQVRSAHFWRGDGRPQENEKPDPSQRDALKANWLQWVEKESHRRLFWVVYALDTQFTSLLYQPAMFALGEVCDMCCPCDEEFWSALSARHWKSLLGPALIPPARVFSAAMAPFLWIRWKMPDASSTNLEISFVANRPPTLALNNWSAFLILITLQNQIFQFSQENMFWNSCFGEEQMAENREELNDSDSELTLAHQQCPGLKLELRNRRKQLRDALSLWEDAYLFNQSRHNLHATCIHFSRSSSTGHVLALILLDIPFTDLQKSLGKNGKEGIIAAVSNLRRWMDRDPQAAEDIVYTAIETIEYLATKGAHSAVSEQFIIALFLCNVLVWLFVTLASREERRKLLDRCTQDERISKCPQLEHVKKELESGTESSGVGDDEVSSILPTESSWGILRSAAQSLAQIGTWGAALNLALLLQRRSEM